MATRRMIGRRSARAGTAGPRPKARPGPRRSGPPLLRLVLVPAALTLGVTLLRLAGELLGWSPRYFSRAAGGGLAVVGITWLVPLVGLYFGHRLGRAGVRPSSLARAAGLPLAALALAPALVWVAGRLGRGGTATELLTVWAVASLVAAGVAFAAWPALGRVLLVYALAARIPVVGIMWAAMHWNWRTHYDAPPPGFPSMVPLERWWWTGVLPQMTIWVAGTLAVGALFGALGWHLASRREA